MIGILLDSMTFFPLSIIILLVMLQDRRRPLWPVAVMVAPLIIGMVWCIASRSKTLFPVLMVYLLLMSIGLIIYMVCALRQYSRWLRDNYADLEHKEVWQSFVVLTIILLVFAIYVLTDGDLTYEYILQVAVIVLICYLLWRVETLSDLSLLHPQGLPADETATEEIEGDSLLPTIRDNIGALLQQHCIDEQLYLQHDLTVAQLAQAIGVNRLYLSQYFSRQGLSYNAYINDLRINHFVSLYREAVAAQRPFTAQQLAHDSGYQSYSTFSLAFKQRMGQSVTVWMRSAD
jgi:AraC-like DNA-binding protein